MTASGAGPPQRRSLGSWVAISIAAVLGAVLAAQHPAPLANPGQCPGAFDLLAVIVSRTWRDVALATLLSAGNAVALVAALLLLARMVHAVAASVGIALAITLAVAMSAPLAAALAPSPAVALLVVGAAWIGVLRVNVATIVVLLSAVAATVTTLTVPAVVTAGWLAWTRASGSTPPSRRILQTTLAAIVVMGSVAVVQASLPSVPSASGLTSIATCMLPDPNLAAWTSAWRAFGGVLADSPLVTAIAALGLLSIGRLPHAVAISFPALALASWWGALVVPGQPEQALAPFVLAFWVLVAAGLANVWEALGRTAGGKAGAIALSVTLVALQMSGAARRERGRQADGHERLTAAMMGGIVGSMPRGAGLVTEDAIIDLLTRALPSRLRSAERFQMVPADPDIISGVLKTSRVFVLPESQRVLQHLGLELTDAATSGVTGLAEVSQAHACSVDLASTPTELTLVAGRRQLGLVAADDLSRGHVLIMLTADVPLSVMPLGWPQDAMRGLHARTFDSNSALDQRDLAEELQSYELSSWSRPNTRFVTRIEMWRTPEAPRVLPIALEGVALAGTARILGPSAGQRLRICPSFPYDIRPLANSGRP